MASALLQQLKATLVYQLRPVYETLGLWAMLLQGVEKKSAS
jgi:hypothetical protein